jgi:Flp pilus assembly pilin Flp
VFRAISRFLRREEGQDLSEYCLLTALVALIALGIFWRVSGGMASLWSNSNTSINAASDAANTAAGASTTTGATVPAGGNTPNP